MKKVVQTILAVTGAIALASCSGHRQTAPEPTHTPAYDGSSYSGK